MSLSRRATCSTIGLSFQLWERKIIVLIFLFCPKLQRKFQPHKRLIAKTVALYWINVRFVRCGADLGSEFERSDIGFVDLAVRTTEISVTILRVVCRIVGCRCDCSGIACLLPIRG